MTVQDLLKSIEKLKEYYTEEAIKNMDIGYEVIDENETLGIAPILEITVEEIQWEDGNKLTLVLTEFTEEQDTREQVLGYPINLN